VHDHHRPLAGAGTFVGSRSASVDTVLGKYGEDADTYGFPQFCEYVLQVCPFPSVSPTGSPLFPTRQ
jgi:hypothetical protein